jgi:hypothetical protein
MFGGSYDGVALGRRYDEALGIMAALWAGETVDVAGEFFTLRGAKLPVVPVQEPRIPILADCWWPARRPFQHGARWDGIMPYWPALLGDQQGPEGQKPSGRSVVDEFRDMMGCYHSITITDEPGEIVVPGVPDEEFQEACLEHGVTWMLRSRFDSPDALRAGPPS